MRFISPLLVILFIGCLLPPAASAQETEAISRLVQKFILQFNNTTFHYGVTDDVIELIIHGDPIGCSFEKYRPSERAGLFHFRHKQWAEFFWRVDTLAGKVFIVRNGVFTNYGERFRGEETAVATTLHIEGTPQQPRSFWFRLPQSRLKYLPPEKTLRLETDAGILNYGESWDVQGYVLPGSNSLCFDLRQSAWHNFFWRVNTKSKCLFFVKGGRFGHGGGSQFNRNITVEVVR